MDIHSRMFDGWQCELCERLADKFGRPHGWHAPEFDRLHAHLQQSRRVLHDGKLSVWWHVSREHHLTIDQPLPLGWKLEVGDTVNLRGPSSPVPYVLSVVS